MANDVCPICLTSINTSASNVLTEEQILSQDLSKAPSSGSSNSSASKKENSTLNTSHEAPLLFECGHRLHSSCALTQLAHLPGNEYIHVEGANEIRPDECLEDTTSQEPDQVYSSAKGRNGKQASCDVYEAFAKSGNSINWSMTKCPICRYSMLSHPTIRERFPQYGAMYQKCLKLAECYKEEWNSETCPTDQLSFYVCRRCKTVFIGGKRECEVPSLATELKEEPRLCEECYALNTTSKICPKHGSGAMEFKCRYCCRVAEFVCFATTHLCFFCHTNLSRLTPIPCSGSDCVLGGRHAPNPVEAPLGCVLCRQEQDSGDRYTPLPNWQEEQMAATRRVHEEAIQAGMRQHYEALQRHHGIMGNELQEHLKNLERRAVEDM